MQKQIVVKSYRQNKNINVPVEEKEIERYGNDKVPSYIMPCGSDFPIQYWTTEKLRTEHFMKCDVCKILTGFSSANNVTTDSVTKLWEHGITDKKSYSTVSKGNRLEWNGDLVAIRLENSGRTKQNSDGIYERIFDKDMIIISNTQVASVRRGMMFIRPPTVKSDLRLPLSTIERMINSNLSKIDIVDLEESKYENTEYPYGKQIQEYAVLFTIADTFEQKQYLFSYDENVPFLAEVSYRGISTVKEAMEFLKPDIVKAASKLGIPVKRHGDIFLVETELTDQQVTIVERQVIDSSNRDYRQYDENKAESEYYVAKPVKRYERLSILGTNHNSTLLAGIKNPEYVHKMPKPTKLNTEELQYIRIQYTPDHNTDSDITVDRYLDVSRNQEAILVKGMIRHARKQHKAIKLDKWYIALKNMAVSSFQVDRQNMGFD